MKPVVLELQSQKVFVAFHLSCQSRSNTDVKLGIPGQNCVKSFLLLTSGLIFNWGIAFRFRVFPLFAFSCLLVFDVALYLMS